MNTHPAKLVIACLCAALLVCAQPAPAANGSIYDFNSLPAGNLPWPGEGLQVGPNPDGGAAHPCDGMCVTMPWQGETHANYTTSPSVATYDLTGETKFIIGAPWVIDNDPGSLDARLAEFRIWNAATGRGIGFGLKIVDDAFICKAYVDDARGPDMYGARPGFYSSHDLGHTYQDGSPWTGFAFGQRIDFRLEVDTEANDGEGGGTLYTVKRYFGETAWSAVPGLSNVNLQLATTGADIQNANGYVLSIGWRLVAQDSLIVGIPGGSLTLNKFLDKNLNGIYDGSDEMLSGWDFTVKGPCGCGVYGASPYSGTTDGTGSYSIAGGTATMAGLLDGNYPITEEERDFWDPAAANPAAATVTAGDVSQTVWFGARPLEGDADANGIVDITDFFILKVNFGVSPKLWAEGNFDANTLVDISDFFILKNNFGATHPDYTPAGGAAPTPEPATLGLLALGGIGLLLKRRRR